MKIIGSCKISQKGVFLNGNSVPLLYSKSENWKKELYSNLKLEYPKFHKMDPLAKMAFLSTEMLKKEIDFSNYGENDIALLFANNSSSQFTDLKFIDSYEVKRNPSPSLFVYTLPNILTGELSIRNKWFGENCFFIEEKFDPDFFLEQINFYLSKGSKICLCGWVNADQNNEECFLFLIENDENGIENNKQELTKLYKQSL